MSKDFRSKTLLCGHCSKYFSTWEGYKDQGQDKGYGICRDGQANDIRESRRHQDKISDKIMDAFENPDHVKKFKDMPRWERQYFIEELEKDGIITWSVGRPDKQIKLSTFLIANCIYDKSR